MYYFDNYCRLQPIHALQHEKFKELVDIVSRAKNRVEIPGQKSMRNQIKQLFKDYLLRLRAELNVNIPFPFILNFLILHCRVRLCKEKLV